MPELNLIEDDSSGSPATAPAAARRRRPPRGGGFGRVLVILLALAVIVVALYLANEYGVLNLWGKKSAPETAQQQPVFPEEPFKEPQAAPETTTVAFESKQPPKPAEKLVEVKPQPKVVEKAKAPEPGDVSRMSGTYTLQVSAWKDRETADDQTARLVRAGLPAFVEELRLGGSTWYTVRVGKYASSQEARAALGDMPREIQDQFWIDRVRGQ